MLIDTFHPEFEHNVLLWELCRDCFLGEHAVKNKKDQYLPRLSSQNEHGYDAYLKRSVYYPILSNTISGRLGQIMRKSPIFSGSDSGISWLQDSVTKDKKDMSVFCSRVIEEMMKVGRVGVLADYDEKRQKPYFSLYTAESIVNWHEVDSVLQEVHLVEEGYTINELDRIEPERKIRRCFLDNEGTYMVEVYTVPHLQNTGMPRREPRLIEAYQPLVFGKPLTELPFTFINPNSLLSDVDKPPLLDIALMSLALYRNSADLELSLHTTAISTPYGTGIEEEDLDGDFVLGPSEFKLFRNPDAKIDVLEFKGTGVNAIMESMSNKFTHIASIGGDASFTSNRSAENAETFRLRMAKETSAMSNIVLYAEKGLNHILNFASSWISPNEKLSISVNRDFLDATMSADLLKAINESVVMGLISRKAAFEIRQKNEIYPDEWTFEKEQSLLEEDELPENLTTAMAGTVNMAKNPGITPEDDR